MYDSEEVRDAVRHDMQMFCARWTGAAQGFTDLPSVDLPSVEWAAIRDALTAEGDPHQLREYLEVRASGPRANMREQIAEVILMWLRRLVEEALEAMRPFFDRLREVADAVIGKVVELAEAVGLLERSEPEPFVWQRRPRVPQAQPVRPVDAVAAGRSPAMIMRTRIRGGRR